MNTSTPAERGRLLDTTGSILHAVSDSRLDRDAAQTRRAHDDALRAFMASLPCLDEQVHDWRERVEAIADARAQLLNPSGDDAPPQPTRTSLRARPLLDVGACVVVIADLGAIVHAVVHDHTTHGDITLVCTDGRRRMAFDIHIVFGDAPTRHCVRVGAYVGVVVFLEARQLMAFYAVLVCAYRSDISTGRAVYRSHMNCNMAARHLLYDLIHSDAADWTSFSAARYKPLAALPEALSRHGWSVLPKDRSNVGAWSWHNGPRDEIGTEKSLGIVRDKDDAPTWVVWTGGRLIAATSEMEAVCHADAPFFFDRLSVPRHSDAGVDEARHKHQNDLVPLDDWRLVRDLADREALLEVERAWMVQRGFISPDAVVASYAVHDDVPPRLVGCVTDSVDTIAAHITAYAAYVKGDYGPIDSTTRRHINAMWCRRHLEDAGLPSADNVHDDSGPIDPQGLVTTNWTFSCDLSHVFARAPPYHAIVDIVAHVHIVGESNGTASASFAVAVAQEHTYNVATADDGDDAESIWDPSRSKAGKALETARSALLETLALVAETDERLGDCQPHPLVARNLQSLCASPSTRNVLLRRQCAGEGINVPYALNWAVAHVRCAIALFDDAAAASLGVSSS
ncbi:hypothetical protein pmac_cds_684 [Pandoravirus macleodensis]|uniref:Uncharacterized protein n=1 Tax=Pandoravirus macleodensis TaxID=2107707 RepID=A0A2U7UG13_9VIRU|nr:hypothetical protein pmac_cds_684 [Pandoravirus macleodensis]AVK77372.1 hypothetical protein pmac_cds_684 [Pandoravirus macleodensis]